MAQADGGSLVVNGGQMRALQQSCGDAVVACPKPAVAIELSAAIACPGHPLAITAKGSPAGGTYTWTVEGGELLDASGRPTRDGANVHLKSFRPDNAGGQIPEVKAKVGVTYTQPNGSAKASKDVTVHAVEFEVSGGRPAFSRLEAKEDPTRVFIEGGDPNVPTMNIDNQVTIRLAAACPRKKECAAHYRVGWLQDVTEWEKSYRFRRRLVQWKLLEGPPIRDAEKGATFPFYSEPLTFTDDGDYFKVNHSDSPAFGAFWEDDKHEPPHDSPLAQVVFKLGFTAWLVVQNDQLGTDVPGSLVYLGNFDWSLDCTLNVVAKLPGARRSTPQYCTPQLGAIGKGKGARTPSFTEASANEAAKPESTKR